MRKKYPPVLLTILLFLVTSYSCNTVLLSERRQVAFLPESMLVEMSLTNYNDFLSGHRLSSDSRQTEMVKNSGTRIAEAVESYLREQGLESRINEFKWEFNLIDEDVPNAWAMPGGKIVFYSGIMPITRDESGVAVVMGHEIAHVVARHGNERMSQQLLLQTGGLALSVALKEKPEQTRNMFLTAYGLGSTAGVSLPYSRAHEIEADQLGLIFMAMAGYDPAEAVSFWERMSNLSGNSPPEFLSTHPSSESRIREMKNFLPEAARYYKPR
ncbi:MAG: M48 family metallopeptidase [Bacteroidales bacterium]